MKNLLHCFTCVNTALLLVSGCMAAPAGAAIRIAQINQRIDEIERECVPLRGTARKEVEAKFGTGVPLHKGPSMVPQERPVPPDSPRRAYRICPEGTLEVRYDSDWNVLLANYPNPYTTKNRLPWATASTDQELLPELESRLRQMEAILKAYKKKEG